MNDETRTVLEAVLEALDIPYAATVGQSETRQKILDERLIYLKVTLKAILRDGGQLDEHLPYLSEKLAEHPPIGYVTDVQARERLAQGATWMEAVTVPEAES